MYSASDCTELLECVACGSKHLTKVLDLNNQPLANSYRTSLEEVLPEFLLAINHCQECHHVQLTHAVNPDLMFKDYLYVSGTSKTMHEYMKWFANFVNEYVGFTTVLDIGCNDGTQLNYFKALGADTFGVDPAENLYPISSANHNIHCGYFDDQYAENKKFNVITAQNVFAHGANPLGFLQSAYKCMQDDSLMFIQTSQADMILNNEFDTIYHEHISFFNIKSMDALAKRAGLFLIDVIKSPMHGMSYIFVLSKRNERPAHIENLIAVQTAQGLYDDKTYVDYAKNCNNIVNSLSDTINEMKRRNYYVVGYGAAAKGMTLLNYSKIKLNFVIDDNPLKQGRYTPGSNYQITSIDEIKKYADEKHIVFVPLAWNFFKEIRQRIKNVRDRDDYFISYFPEVKINV